jgi:hypothetical protein
MRVTDRRVPLERVSDRAVEMVRAGELGPYAALAMVLDCVSLGRVRPQAQGPTCQPGFALLIGESGR